MDDPSTDPTVEDAALGEVPVATTPAAAWEPAAWPAPADVLVAGGIEAELAGMLARRGVRTLEQAERFLSPHVDQLLDPFELRGMREAVERLQRARLHGERVAVVGDYDVDGVSGTALLSAALKACRIGTEQILPHRMRDGYGFRQRQVDEAQRLGCSLIVTVDCGTTSAAAIAAARSVGIDVIVTDHHLPGRDFPGDVVQINPKQPGNRYANAELCGAGLAFKLACALYVSLGRTPPIAALLRIAVLGTIADVVPLVGENRTIAALGLRALDEARSPGLRELVRVAGVKSPMRAQDVGFRLGPRINAAGRLDSAQHALDLLLTTDAAEARRLAEALDGWNQRRQGEERRVLEQARAAVLGIGNEADVASVATMAPPDSGLPGILVAWSEEWHRGVVGIAAGRLARELHRPTLLLAVEDGVATGSGRSIDGVHLYDFLAPWRERLERFGGHEHAIGLTVRAEQLEELREAWQRAALWAPEVLQRRLPYELDFDSAARVDRDLFVTLQRLEPYGPGNPVPMIRLGPLENVVPPRVFGNGHLKLMARDRKGARLPLVAWHGERLQQTAADGPYEILGELSWDDYLGCPTLVVRELRRHSGEAHGAPPSGP